MATAKKGSGPAARSDMQYHAKIYYGFLHLAKWFLLHMALLLSGLYFLVIGGAGGGGWFLIAVSVIVIIYGIATISRAGTVQARQSATRIEQGQLATEAAMAGDTGRTTQ